MFDYTYDEAGRLDTVSKDTVLQNDYEYDLNSNRTSIDGGTTINATYDDQDRLETFTDASSTNWTFKYTDNGELERKYETGNQAAKGIIYDYDVLGNLRGVDFQGTVNDIEYIIDGRNRRIGRIKGSNEKYWLYKDQLNPITELDENGNITKRFIYASRTNIPDFMIIPSGVNAGTYRIVSDHLGSPRFVIDTAGGNIVQELDYDEWGNVLVDTNPDFTPFGFAGGLYDQDTKLVRFGARDYDPETGRWTSKDPIRFFGNEINLFSYSFQSPINLQDFSGLNASWCFVPGRRCNGPEMGGSGPGGSGGGLGGRGLKFKDVVKSLKEICFGNRNRPKIGDSFPNRDLPRDKHGRPIPESSDPHTQLGKRTGKNGERYPQAREFEKDGQPKRDIDFTDHGKPNSHPSPHFHPYMEGFGFPGKRGPAQPFLY